MTAGGCNASTEARSSSPVVDTSVFEADQEEADTRLVLHCIRTNNRETVVVSARDTDFLLLLVAHSSSIPSPNVWMMVGSATRRKFFNIKAVSEKLAAGSLPALLPFHALTVSDTNSYITNHSKVSPWKIFQRHSFHKDI